MKTDANVKARKELRSDINAMIVDLRRELNWAEANPLLPRHERQNKVNTTMRALERAVLGYGRLLP